MKNSELRKLARVSMKGKMKKASLHTALYTFIIGLLNNIPFAFVLNIPLGFGFIKEILKIQNSENAKPCDFFEYGMKNFGKVWCTHLLVLLRFLAPLCISLISFGLTEVFASDFTKIILLSIGFISSISTFFIMLKYSLVNYELYYNPELKAQEIIKKHKITIKGNVWKIIRMNVYYSMIEVILLLVIPLIGILTCAAVWECFTDEYSKAFIGIFVEIIMIAIFCVITVVASIFIAALINPRLITANNELYKYLSGKNSLLENENIVSDNKIE